VEARALVKERGMSILNAGFVAAYYTGCTTATSPCHSAASPGARLDMRDVNTAYNALVNVASATSLCAAGGGTIRVIPGDPDRSCLVLFYQGRLKDDRQWVDQAEIDLVRRWIAEGARPNVVTLAAHLR
jgi:hypothetical protein